MEPTESKRECWAVGFGNSIGQERMVAAGYDNGEIKVWDLRQMKLIWETSVDNGVCWIEWDRQNIKMNKLTAVTLEGWVHVWDCRNQWKESKKKVEGGTSTVWVGKHCPDNRDILLTGSGGGLLSIWREGTDEIELLQTQALAEQPVCALDWCPDKKGLVATASFDQRLRIVIITKLKNV
ncbi:WD repeat-containing protein 92 [Eurytemora carolleeae]|uniref:WD repeat-containing protein 92 n=1 Tax=Eurytemora carolleeae TaxID=1294199 RepID=UPI000C793995|nr:WD repeat-containing protein 92 [Eurytemora carolleeae]|eukprot:XP_023319603.1 WD repeat-containing protein 92-like [Eurytemora affinis]